MLGQTTMCLFSSSTHQFPTFRVMNWEETQLFLHIIPYWKKPLPFWGCSSVVEYWQSLCKTLGYISSPGNKTKKLTLVFVSHLLKGTQHCFSVAGVEPIFSSGGSLCFCGGSWGRLQGASPLIMQTVPFLEKSGHKLHSSGCTWEWSFLAV